MHTKHSIVLFKHKEVSGVQKSEVEVTSTSKTIKKTEVVQSEQWKYKLYQSLVKWYDINSLVTDTIFIFTKYTLISPLTIKQEAHGPQLAHLSETATADMQMACNIFPILLWQGNGLNSFWNILLTRLKCWNFQNVTSKISHPQCLLPTFESTGISVQ